MALMTALGVCVVAALIAFGAKWALDNIRFRKADNPETKD